MDDEKKPDRAPQKTPWGEKQLESYDPELGFTHVETGGHGGLWLDEKQRAQIPDYLKKHSQGGEGQWWEEDCAWFLPTMYFLSQRPGKDPSDHFMAEHAKETAREYYPDCLQEADRSENPALERYCPHRPQAGRCRPRRAGPQQRSGPGAITFPPFTIC